MGYRYQKPTDRESEVRFRVVEICVVNSSNNRTERGNRFLLVDNGQETLEAVQKEMESFVRTAILANKLGKMEQRREYVEKCPAHADLRR
jgi:hypothetical protein